MPAREVYVAETWLFSFSKRRGFASFFGPNKSLDAFVNSAHLCTIQNPLKRVVFRRGRRFSPTPVGEDDDQPSWQVGYTRAPGRFGVVSFATSGHIPSPYHNLMLGGPALRGFEKGRL